MKRRNRLPITRLVDFVLRAYGPITSLVDTPPQSIMRRLLQGGEKLGDAQLEIELVRIISIFYYLPDKDTFAEIYRSVEVLQFSVCAFFAHTCSIPPPPAFCPHVHIGTTWDGMSMSVPVGTNSPNDCSTAVVLASMPRNR
jgi:hypothetical protein